MATVVAPIVVASPVVDAIPLIDAAPLFEDADAARARSDAAIASAAKQSGFLVLQGLPPDVPLGAEARDDLLRLFSLPQASRRRLWRQKWAPGNPNVYRGWFPLEGGFIKEGFDLGPEHAHADPRGDALLEATPMPSERELPGWATSARACFLALERVGRVLMQSLARGLGLESGYFDEPFEGGNSTFRLIAYPPWPEVARQHDLTLRPVASPDGVRRYDIGGEHVDSGFVTLLQQDTVGGLQARLGDGFVDVPPIEGSLVVNFGKLLERWTGGRIRATEHRVLGNDRARHSIPFFYEPRVDATIAPPPLADPPRFEPFTYGDHVWEAMSRFVEFEGMQRWPG